MPVTLTPGNASAALKTAALATVISVGWAELSRRTTRIIGHTRGATLLDIAHLVLSLVTIFLYAAKSYILWPQNVLVPMDQAVLLNVAACDCITAITVAIVCLVSLQRFFGAQYSSSCLFLVVAIVFTASATDVCGFQARLVASTSLTAEGDFATSLLILNALIPCVTAGNLVACGLRDTLVYSRRSGKFQVTGEEESYSPLGLFVCIPIHRNLKNILGKSVTRVRDLIKPSLHSLCARTVRKLYGAVRKGASSGSQRRFMFGLFRVVWRDLLWIISSGIAYYLVVIGRAMVLESLIAGTSNMASMILLFAISCLADGALTCYMNHNALRFTEKVQVLTQGAILRRVLNYSPAERAKVSSGYIVSVMGVDCTILAFSAQLILLPVSGLLTLPIVIYMLTTRVGLGPGLSCGSVLLAALIGFWIAVVSYYSLQRRSMKLRDDRLKSMLDLLSSIRTVKMYAWEQNHLDSLKRLRERELRHVLKVNMINGTVDAIYSALSSLLIIIMYGALALLDPTRLLTASEAFSCIYLLSLIEGFCATLTIAMRTINSTGIALHRAVKLCTGEEASDDPVFITDSCVQKGEVLLQDCTFSRTGDEGCQPALKGINLSVPPGSLVAIVGFVGSGKSTLLAAILGDLHRVEGTIRISGTIGYVPQAATVFNATLRDNILFGKSYDPALYRRVLEACELVKDINSFPAGDLTEIGEKGYNLSGGQKQRVSLARAAYHQCSIYVLDDPLSALDPQVGSKVFKKLLGKSGMLRDKTRLLVTNQGYLLKHVDQLYLMHGKTGVSYSRHSELLKDPRAPATLTLGTPGTALLEQEKTTEAYDAKEDQSKGKIIKDEKNVSTKSASEVMWATLKMCGWCLWPGVLCLAASAAAASWQLVWIKDWTDASAPGSTRNPYDPYWMQGLAALSVGAVATRLAGNVLLSFAINRLSRVLHHDMLEHVLFSPVSFFDATPRGRILNRFTSDLNDVDTRMAVLGRQTIQNSLVALSRLAVIGTESLAIIGVGVVVLVIFTVGLSVLTRAVNATRYIRSAHFSRVLQHVTETVDSLTIVRVFGMTERFYARFCRLADQNLRVSLASVTCGRLTRTFAVACSQVIVLCTLLFSVIGMNPDDVSSSSSIGLSLNSSLSIPSMMSMICITYLGMTQIMVALERDIEFTELPKEVEVEKVVVESRKRSKPDSNGSSSLTPVHRIDSTWPTHGCIEFQDFSASYRPMVLEDSLKHVTFTVHSKQKVGIVGRTGAGKSSLVLALLRVLKSTNGRILIDDVDIASVPLPRLRTAITVIPQDPNLVRGTLRANLDPTQKHSDDELWQVLRQANLAEFVSRQPLKLLLETGDGGSNLSAGQRQLVCLARALLRRPKILVLDEATSHMDGDTDRLIQATLRDSFANFTLLTVAHRLHTVLDYDRILVMSEGTVVEYGTLDELLSDRTSMFYDMATKAGIVPSCLPDKDLPPLSEPSTTHL
ncbi:ATP-binding cassette sub-family C member 2-like isoform X2 [Dermacentor silvarum]|uniref:ATP-binding cassette sub-family C member 2-like isoform X2 n=1 Tax=Dermacentor silvarum TaxID=543639 RepID=UPI00210133A4|nr:ATP-binding cassette sub-family C member 2-like isoform X2 [Dermacentor silvarum]